MNKIVIGMSGGMDSSTLLGHFLNKGYTVYCLNFQYGSKHNSYELLAFNQVIDYYQKQNQPVIKADALKLSGIFDLLASNLLKSGGEIPEGHYADENMKKTVVPGRNLIFSSILAAIAESNNCQFIGLGVHSGDHAIYPDCRPGFINNLHETIMESTDGKVGVEAPFISLDKTEILKIGYGHKIPVPYKFTRTCYKDQEKSCGKCGSCRERLEAFENINLTDPIDYE